MNKLQVLQDQNQFKKDSQTYTQSCQSKKNRVQLNKSSYRNIFRGHSTNNNSSKSLTKTTSQVQQKLQNKGENQNKQNNLNIEHKKPLNGTRQSINIQQQQNKISQAQLNKEPEDENKGSKLIQVGFAIAALVGIAGLIYVGIHYGGFIRQKLDYFTLIVNEMGPEGVLAYMGVYIVLELLAVPAIPLTMTAGIIFRPEDGSGAIFGPIKGVCIVSICSTIAATLAFLVTKYYLRDRIVEMARKNPKFTAVDKAIGKNGFQVVAALRLSPLLPLSASNYLYGLTSVSLFQYVAASWLGMLPGSIAYVLAGYYGLQVAEGHQGSQWWQLAIGAGVTIASLYYVTKIAKDALGDLEENQEKQI